MYKYTNITTDTTVTTIATGTLKKDSHILYFVDDRFNIANLNAATMAVQNGTIAIKEINALWWIDLNTRSASQIITLINRIAKMRRGDEDTACGPGTRIVGSIFLMLQFEIATHLKKLLVELNDADRGSSPDTSTTAVVPSSLTDPDQQHFFEKSRTADISNCDASKGTRILRPALSLNEVPLTETGHDLAMATDSKGRRITN